MVTDKYYHLKQMIYVEFSVLATILGFTLFNIVIIK
jgi:hypothetical protein